MRLIAGLTLAALALGTTACHRDEWHLISVEKGNPADIRIRGDSGDASWTWGPDAHSVDVAVVSNELIGDPLPATGGALVLQLADGTTLEFAGQYNALVCSRGCDAKHMPIAWHVQRD
ncbi:hypothetical protein [Luteibacter sp. 329MFSha]|uniref:hypothetical protein n=1 Tax=Luteibacter sp. 329MFSha TaxID=1798239 RepID=UPI0008B37ADF|nr:hypothetical protein [Luteibacter sp. 329MFSha]SEV95025.1 hypothetical protein SAMN04515660_1239 [Luteibacter sp. 329MFSha]